MAVALFTSLVAAIVGAVIGSLVTIYLQKRWGHDYSKELTALREQIAALQKQHETMEQERAEAEHLRLNMSLQHGYSPNYTVQVENDSDREITIEKTGLRRDDVWLCELCEPKATNTDLNVPPKLDKQISLAPQHDPIRTLRSMEPELQPGKCIAVELVMDYRVFGRPKQFRKKILVTVDGYQMTQFSP